MGKKHFTEEQIAFALRQAESGTSVAEIIRKLGISEQTFYRWKKRSAGYKKVTDVDAWTKDTNNQNPIIGRLKPLPPHAEVNDLGDEGSVLVVSTVQALWDTNKKMLQSDSILGHLNSEYDLNKQLNYLDDTLWRHQGNWVSFSHVEPQKGTTIYVYGELDGDENNGSEVYVYSQNIGNNSWTSLTKGVPDVSTHTIQL